ncbi:hypothetical protein F1904_11690 [Akkermansia muciniphila]|uniref:hypothetical protein n=1 Tax=Akkermansia muciniphila TaxID=239935 RepID=UPI00122FA8BB|nr:hypothetical protein F1904_11690 [Akkermansia muciniphila]
MATLTIEELNIVISAKTDGINKKIEQINKRVDGMVSHTEKASGKMNSAFSKIGNVIGLVLGVKAVKAVLSLGKEAIGLASDLTEVQNVVDTAFGSMSGQVEEWASHSIEQFGMSKLAAKQTASTYMAMSKGLGMAGQAAADMAMDVAGLTADVASFYNVSQSEADTALKSIWTGETESLKKFGVVMTQTNLQQFAYQQGISKSIAKMTQAEQVQLRYKYVTQQLSIAQGDFAKTSDSWANQTRILSERWKEFLSLMGSGLIQILTPVLKMLNTVMSGLIAFAQTFSSVINGLFGKQSTQQKEIANTATAAAGAETKMAQATDKAAKAAKRSLAGIDQMNILQAQTASSGSDADAGAGAGISVPSVGDIGEGMKVSDDVQKTIDKFRSILDGVKKAAQPTIDALGRLKKAFDPFAANVGKGLKWAWDNVLAPMGKWVLSKAVPTFLDLLSGAFKTLNGLLDAFKPIGKWLWEKFLQPIASWTGGVIVSVLGGVAEKLSAVGDWIGNHGEETTAIIAGIGGAFATWKISNMLQDIKKLTGDKGLGALGKAIKTVTEDHFPKLTGAFDKVSGAIKGFGSKIGKGIQTFLSSKFGLIAIAVGALITVIVLCVQHWDEIKQAAIDVWNGIVSVWNAAGAWFNDNVIQPIVGFFDGLWSDIKSGASDVWEGIKSVFSSVGKWFHDVFSDAWEGIVSIFSKGGKVFEGIKEGISNAFRGAVNVIVKGINKVVAMPLDFLNGILNKIRNLSFLGISPFKGLWKENPIYVPQIPLLANGALAYGPTLAMIGEGRDNEALLPLNNQVYARLGRGIAQNGGNIGIDYNRLQSIIMSALQSLGIIANIQLDGEPVARKVLKIQRKNQWLTNV